MPAARVLPIAGGVGMVVAAFLPWANASMPLAGTISASVLDTKYGWLTVVVGVAVIALGLSMLQRRRVAVRVGLAVAALAMGAVCVYAYARISSLFADVNLGARIGGDLLGVSPHDLADTSYGIGLYLMSVSSAVTLIGAVLPRGQEA